MTIISLPGHPFWFDFLAGLRKNLQGRALRVMILLALEATMQIIVRDFVYEQVKWWIEQAKKHWENNEPALSFICAWVVFDHCYSLFARVYIDALRLRKKTSIELEDLRGRVQRVYFPPNRPKKEEGYYIPDHLEIALFVGKKNSGFQEFWDYFRKKQETPKYEMPLPIKDLTWRNDIPNEGAAPARLIDMELRPLFLTLLTIRNNLFHGGKSFGRKEYEDERNFNICSSAAEFMVPFVDELTTNIEP